MPEPTCPTAQELAGVVSEWLDGGAISEHYVGSEVDPETDVICQDRYAHGGVSVLPPGQTEEFRSSLHAILEPNDGAWQVDNGVGTVPYSSDEDGRHPIEENTWCYDYPPLVRERICR